MSRLFGEIRQMGYVVRDIEDAMHHWIEVCGVGPWFYIDKLPMFDFYYRGQAGDPHLSIALANSGDVQVELIQQRDDTPTMYQDFWGADWKGCSIGRAGQKTTIRCINRRWRRVMR